MVTKSTPVTNDVVVMCCRLPDPRVLIGGDEFRARERSGWHERDDDGKEHGRAEVDGPGGAGHGAGQALRQRGGGAGRWPDRRGGGGGWPSPAPSRGPGGRG